MSEQPGGDFNYLISTGSLMELTAQTGFRAARGLLRRDPEPFVPEIQRTFELAEKLNLGVELVYRVGMESAVVQLTQAQLRRIKHVHGPVMYDLDSVLLDHPYWKQLGEEGPVLKRIKKTGLSYAQGVAANLFMLGSVYHHIDQTVEFADKVGALVVLHPEGTRRLFKDRPDMVRSLGKKLGYEPDWPMPFTRTTDRPLTWQSAAVLSDVEQMGTGIVVDWSHWAIGHNPKPEKYGTNLVRTLEDYGDRVVGHHISAVATNGRYDTAGLRPIYQGGGALPLNSPLLTEEHRSGMRETARYIRAKALVNGNQVFGALEIYAWQSGEDRERGIYESLNLLETGNPVNISRSFRGARTRVT